MRNILLTLVRKEKNWKGGIKITEGNYNSAEGTNGKNLRQNIKKVIDQGYRKYHRRQNKIPMKSKHHRKILKR